MKYFPIVLLLVALAMGVGSYMQPGSGWGVGAATFGIVSALWVGISKYRTGMWFTDSAGGH